MRAPSRGTGGRNSETEDELVKGDNDSAPRAGFRIGELAIPDVAARSSGHSAGRKTATPRDRRPGISR